MLRILLKQVIHIWKSLELRHKLEAGFLFIIIYAFLATRLTGLFENWLNTSASAGELTILFVQFFILSITLTTLFIFRYLLQKQQLLRVLLGKPLIKTDVLKAILFVSFKYNSAYLLLILPLANALLISTGIVWSALFLTGLILNLLFQTILIFLLFLKIDSKALFVFLTVFLILLYNTLFGFLYWQTDLVLLYFLLTTVIGLLLSWFLLKRTKIINLEERIKPYKEEHRIKGKISYQNAISLKLPAGILSQLVLKEFHGLWRNMAYRRLKYISVFVYLILLLLIISGGFEEKTVWLSAMTFLFMWHHYSNAFNEKYVTPEPEWLIRTIPIRFRQLITAKFIAEIPFVILLLGFFTVILLFLPVPLADILQALLILLFAAIIILLSMINFQIMFYNDARLAGYAFHFTLLFLAIMSLNYHFVGPLISVLLMGFYFYKNVRYFYTC